MSTTVTDRISSAKVYLEPDLYLLAQKEAKKLDVTLSAWIRKLILAKLLENGVVDQELILKIATG